MTTQEILQGVHDWTNGKIVYDISVAHPDGQGKPTPYADLTAALGAGGANIPQGLRKGGMSVKFIKGSAQGSDNKYIRYNLMAQTFTTDTTQWQGVDDKPTKGSDNFVKSGGVYLKINQEINQEKQRAETSEQHLQESIDSVKEETLEENREMVNSIMENYAPVEITGDVSNAADEEDLTSVNVEGTDVLKFKDKVYNPLVYSGLGRKILRKNIVNGVNTLTQDMMPIATEEGQEDPGRNTIYIIQYDFTLGEDITVPANCVLQFDGGSLNGGELIFNKTTIGEGSKINCIVSGTIANDTLNISYFGCSKDGDSDCSSIIQNLLLMEKPLYVPDGTFLISNQITIPTPSISIYGNGKSSILKCTCQDYAFVYPTQSSNEPLRLTLSSIQAVGTYPSFYSSIPTADITDESKFFKSFFYTYECNINNCIFTNFKEAIYLHMGFYAKIHQNSFFNCYDAFTITEGNASAFTNNNFNFIFHAGLIFKGRGDGVNEETLGILISGNSFQNSGFTGIWVLSKNFINNVIIGNYFEKAIREDTDNPNREIIVGDVNNSQGLNFSPSMSGCLIRGNSGLWAPRGIYLNNCTFSNNTLISNILLGENVEGKDNVGNLEDYNALYLYYDGNIYGQHFRYGRLPKSLEYQDILIKENNVCVPANSDLQLKTQRGADAYKLLYFLSSDSGITLVMKTTDTTPQYIAGGINEQQVEYGRESSDIVDDIWDTNNLPKLIGSTKTVKIILKNTTDKNICTDINIKYCLS